MSKIIPRVLLILAIIVFWLGVLASLLPAQALPPNVEAATSCLGGRVTTIVNLKTLFDYDSTGAFVLTDSAQEVIAHELIHQAQAKKWYPQCPPYGMHPALLLHDEVEAYCDTRRRIIARRNLPLEEANKEIVEVLIEQFNGVSAHDVAQAWERGCP